MPSEVRFDVMSDVLVEYAEPAFDELRVEFMIEPVPLDPIRARLVEELRQMDAYLKGKIQEVMEIPPQLLAWEKTEKSRRFQTVASMVECRLAIARRCAAVFDGVVIYRVFLGRSSWGGMPLLRALCPEGPTVACDDCPRQMHPRHAWVGKRSGTSLCPVCLRRWIKAGRARRGGDF